jgi:hypothetical protein
MSAKRITILFLVLACFAVLSACSTRAPKPTEQVFKSHPVKKIALVMVMDPPRLSVENRGSALQFLAFAGYFVEKKIEDGKSDRLTSSLRNLSLKFGEEMSTALQIELVRMGYEVSIITDVKRPFDDPETILYESIKTDADAILSARYTDVGLYSGQFSKSYLPRLNVYVEMLPAKDQDDDLYSQSIYYGADASKADKGKIPSDPKYSYESFELAMEKQSEVAESFRAGIHAIAVQVARQIRHNGV